jgi:cellulose 1,4-beta-cellobiosidase
VTGATGVGVTGATGPQGPGGGSANIVEAATPAGFPATGASQTIYHAHDVRRIYFWDATAGVYAEAGPSGGGGGSGGDGTDTVLRALLVPAAPTSVTAAAGNEQVALSWTAPTGVIAPLPITDYVVQYSTNSGSTWTNFTAAASTATSATVTGLTNGTSYVFRVAAVNGVGVGAYTAASSAVTPTVGTPPNAPTSLTATAGNAQIALSWTAPSAPGTYAITGYTVEYTPSGGSAQTVSTGSTGTTYTLTGLTNGTAYTVRVRAVSASGAGTYSATATGTPSSGGISITAGINTGGWAGAGTSASPYTRDVLGGCGVDGGVILTSFTVSGSGTVTVAVAYVDQHCGDSDPSLGIFKNNSLVASIGFRSSGSRTVAVINGDVISLRSADQNSNVAPQSISVYKVE